MATVRLDNLIKPRQANSPLTTLSKEEEKNLSVFTDLKLDLELARSIGVGINPTQAKDIVVSNDIEAIRNAIYNIFTTKKGQKLLDPEFGSSLEQYLFESVSPIVGKIIGDSIVNSIETYEPRVEVLNVTVYPNAEENLYKIKLTFKFVDINKTSSIDMLIEKNGQITL
jgi:phage baseplate assembly protein W